MKILSCRHDHSACLACVGEQPVYNTPADVLHSARDLEPFFFFFTPSVKKKEGGRPVRHVCALSSMGKFADAVTPLPFRKNSAAL